MYILQPCQYYENNGTSETNVDNNCLNVYCILDIVTYLELSLENKTSSLLVDNA